MVLQRRLDLLGEFRSGPSGKFRHISMHDDLSIAGDPFAVQNPVSSVGNFNQWHS